MENQQWNAKYQQSVVLSLDGTDESSHNGICDNPVEKVDNGVDAGRDVDESIINGSCDNSARIQVVEAAISEKSRHTIQNILEEVKKLSKLEKLLLYLKLPTEYSSSIDPLRQPLNPLGSRAEIHRTISWIKTHLEEDPETSLPKQDVYDEYSNYCNANKIKPLSQADFGKVMKQVYPKVRARRLGTRGKSRYCYSGLKRRHKLDAPVLPDLADKPLSTEPSCTQADLMAATWVIIKEWSESQLGNQFPSLHALACYLVLNLSISSGSAAAALVTSVTENHFKDDDLSPGVYGSTKHREMQLQLQRKLQQKNEFNRDQKRKLQPQQNKTEPKQRCKRSRIQPQTVNQSTSSSTSPVSVAADLATSETNTSPSQGPQTVCDKSLDYTNLQTLPDFSSFQKPALCDAKGGDKVLDLAVEDEDGKTPSVAGKVPIPRLSSGQNRAPQLLSPKRAKNVKYKAIQPKPEPCDIVSYNPQPILNVQAAETRSQQDASKSKKQRKRKGSQDIREDVVPILEQVTPFTRERLESVGSVDKDAMDEYLGTNNSQEHEEELLKYFKNNNTDEPEQENSTKLSQLRQLLEKNCVADTRIALQKNLDANSAPVAKTIISKNRVKEVSQPSALRQCRPNVPPNIHTNTRRRVSFETPLHEDAVPPSPNTRRKNFSFTPISPGPLSPNRRQSKCSSTTASPFVSPRNTPVPRLRTSCHHNYSNSQPAALGGLLNIANARRQINMNKTGAKIKQELELSLDVTANAVKGYSTMSAPPSPMLPGKTQMNLLQKLLNSSNKVPYTPDYSQSHVQTPHSADSLSTEISQFFAADVQQNSELCYRSQSVPLHQMALKSDPNAVVALEHNSYLPHFNFNFPENETITTGNDFNDLDALSEPENINVHKIINALEDTPNETILQNHESDVSDFEGLNLNLAPEQDSFSIGDNVNFEVGQFRALGRSQSVDIGIGDMGIKFNPSRSVPSTPLPLGKLKSDAEKIVTAHNSRSYPSTPLLVSETFNYTHSHDYLLNGQPVKDKVNDTINVQPNAELIAGTEINDDVIYNNMEFYSMNDVNLNSDVLVDNKGGFSFDRQLSDSNYNVKENGGSVLDEQYIILVNEQNFDGNMNGS